MNIFEESERKPLIAATFVAGFGLIVGIIAQILFLMNWPLVPFRAFQNWFMYIYGVGGLIVGATASAIGARYFRSGILQRDKDGFFKKDIWTILLKECPRWMKYLVAIFFLYALLNFFFIDIRFQGTLLNDREFLLLATPVLMSLYCTSMAVLYSSIRSGQGG
jgi:hypothetical protein